MVIATSTSCTAQFHDLGLTLVAGVPTPIPDDPAIVAALRAFPGVVIENADPTAPAPTPEEK